MLNKNIYIIYPAGYSGRYVSWALAVSDQDQTDVVREPLNTDTSKKLGGKGTSHNHVRTPTHQAIRDHLTWVLYNQPKHPKTYIINSNIDNVSTTIDCILRYDPDPVFILVHDDNDKDVRTYGSINCHLKWPVYIYLRDQDHRIATGNSLINWDPYNFKDSIEARNDIALKKIDLPPRMPPLSESTRSLFETEYKKTVAWFQARNHFHPHEVDAANYLVPEKFPDDKIYQISCRDIASDNFLTFLSNFLTNSGAVTNFDTGYVEQYHRNYVDAQENLQWFDSILLWRQTGKIDDYLNSHSAIQGFVIREMLENLGWCSTYQAKLKEWQIYYNKIKDESWPECEYPDDMDQLPDRVLKEMQEMFTVDYDRFKTYRLRDALTLSDSWQTLSLEEINKKYLALL